MHFILILLNYETYIYSNIFLETKQSYPVFKDPQRYPELADPKLEGNFPMRSLHQAVAVAAMCLNEEPSVRPLISDVVTALSFLGIDPMNQDPQVLSPIDMPSPTQKNEESSATLSLLDDDSAVERQKAIDEAMEWGSNTRNKPRPDSSSSL